MIKQITLFSLLLLLFNACDSEVYQANGVHFQGRDCLACHNSELQTPYHQEFAGTLFKDKSTLATCKITPTLELIDSNTNKVVLNTKYSSIYAGDGNFALFKSTQKLSGNYLVRLLDDNGTLLTHSIAPHAFNAEYQPTLPDDSNTRYSCNACHNSNAKGGTSGVLYLKDINTTQINTLCN